MESGEGVAGEGGKRGLHGRGEEVAREVGKGLEEEVKEG